MTDKILLTAAFLLGALVALKAVVWLATVGDKKWSEHRERLRLVTPYVPPANSRPNDFDKYGRTY